MAFDFDKIKNKLSESVADAKQSETLKKVVGTSKDVAGKLKDKAESIDTDKIIEKSQDLFDDTKQTIKRAGNEINERIDKLRR